jgi:hypothetical protein
MDTKLREVMVYLLKNYPFKAELSNARLTKLIYLADWKSALKYKRQITGTRWKFDNYGPFVWDVFITATSFPAIFEVENGTNSYGEKKTLIKLSDEKYQTNLSNEEKAILDFVINSTKPLNWSGFIQLVYSTFPILISERNSYLDLVELANLKEKFKIKGNKTEE